MDWKKAWSARSEMSFIQAAYLICGLDPFSPEQDSQSHGQLPEGVGPILNELLDYANKKYKRETLEIGGSLRGWLKPGRDETVDKSLVVEWLSNVGLESDIFILSPEKFTSDETVASYLNPSHDFYAPKLVAAIAVWKAIANNPKMLSGKSPKQAIDKWLHDNAGEYGLIQKNGNINQAGIDQISKVVNWKPDGGVPKTPGSKDVG